MVHKLSAKILQMFLSLQRNKKAGASTVVAKWRSGKNITHVIELKLNISNYALQCPWLGSKLQLLISHFTNIVAFSNFLIF